MQIQKTNVEEYLSESYLKYSGYVAQNRAIVDSRDGLKVGARKILYSMWEKNNTFEKPRRKGTKVVGDVMSYSVHGSGPIYGNLVRLGQPFSLRYPLIDVQGNFGTMRSGDDYGADRYVEYRLDKKSGEMLKFLKKNLIKDWQDNYDNTEKFPSVLPSYFPNVLVNGNTGIGVGLASSIPQFNLREVCSSLIKAVQNPDLGFDDLFCIPDFCTGGILSNESQIRESLKNGKGPSCTLLAKMEYDADLNEIIVRELPYQVFTITICEQLERALQEFKLPGVESFFDGTDFTGINIHIKLTKHANVNKVISQLYKETSLRSHFGINMVMLQDGRVPRVYGWVDMVYTYLNHLKMMIRKSYEWDISQSKARLHIITGFLKAIDLIDEIIKDIKASAGTADASKTLKLKYQFSDEQTKAILDMKLSKLARIEKEKLEQEKVEHEKNIKIWEHILGPGFEEEVIRTINQIKNEYGDGRRTEIKEVFTGDTDTPAIQKELLVHISEKGTVIATESNQYLVQSRGGKGTKIKMRPGDLLKETVSGSNSEYLMLLSNQGRAYSLYLNDLEIGKETHFKSLLELGENEDIITLLPYSKVNNYDYVIFLTKNGTIKKTSISEYLNKKKTGLTAIKFRDGDEIASITFAKKEDFLFIISRNGYTIKISETNISETGRVSIGVAGIKLGEKDEALAIIPINENFIEICTITDSGLIKRTPISDFNQTNRGTKGVLVQKLKEEDKIASATCLTPADKSVIIISETNTIRIPISEIPVLNRTTQGNHAMKTDTKIVKMLVSNI